MNWRNFLLLAFALPAVLAGCQEHKADSTVSIRPLLSVVVTPQAAQRLQFAGTIEPRIKAELGFRVLGRVIKRDVKVGDIVTKGQVIAMLDPRVLELSVRSAEAELSNAEAQMRNATLAERRQFQLSQVNSATQAEYENALLTKESADAAVAKAQAYLAKAREQLKYSKLHAEFDGVITAVSAEVGQVLSAGETAFIEARPDLRDAVIDIPEDDISSIAQGTAFDISLLLDPSISASGTVREIAPQSDATTRTHRVKITLDNPPSFFRLGTIVSATATTDASPQIVLPQSAILRDGDSTFVWVVNPDTKSVSRRAVTIRNKDKTAEKVIILSGLKTGERIAVAGVHSLQDGQQVRIDRESLL
jgi:membrane fusion protein, multidrug efflux system